MSLSESFLQQEHSAAFVKINARHPNCWYKQKIYVVGPASYSGNSLKQLTCLLAAQLSNILPSCPGKLLTPRAAPLQVFSYPYNRPLTATAVQLSIYWPWNPDRRHAPAAAWRCPRGDQLRPRRERSGRPCCLSHPPDQSKWTLVKLSLRFSLQYIYSLMHYI